LLKTFYSTVALFDLDENWKSPNRAVGLRIYYWLVGLSQSTRAGASADASVGPWPPSTASGTEQATTSAKREAISIPFSAIGSSIVFVQNYVAQPQTMDQTVGPLTRHKLSFAHTKTKDGVS
jgi:hypothetical protein